ncbi:MAG: glycerol-3-phosphate 1-O-acyltransferase PlsY [Gammaproteobacteria bacterium]
MITIISMLVLAYLLGSINGSLVLGLLRHIDIRKEGSGNAGGTNALRTHGKLFALGVILIDVLKAVLAVGVLPVLAELAPDSLQWLQLGCGVAVVVGHCYPVFFGFRGGKGMATLLGVYAVLSPIVLLVAVVTWLLALALFGYVGLATMMAASAAPIYLAIAGPASAGPMILFSLLMAAFIAFTHRGNIERLQRGTEPRMVRGVLGSRR